jgi:serine/threonine protein kinase HipA of HipAB toxin-antitoxin module
MSHYADTLRAMLASGPASARQMAVALDVSAPQIALLLLELGDAVLPTGTAQSLLYALHDTARGVPDLPVYIVDSEGRLRQLGRLRPVCPEGFVTCHSDGVQRHSDALPWWLLDMRPQGYLGRAYAARHGATLQQSGRLAEWTDAHALRALSAHGHDVVGNLLLGETARDRFLATAAAAPISLEEKAETYARLAREAARGKISGPAVGGEQPKFTAYAETPSGPRHVIIKFSERAGGARNERWRDLLLAEHLALETLSEGGIPAATTRLLDHGQQRFLEVERFDRAGARGRHGLFSLAALDAEFVGSASGGWPRITRRLAAAGLIRPEAADGAELLWAFGTLIGNTDMHNGNLSFLVGHGHPYALAPAYDMTPMVFRPHGNGDLPEALPDALPEATLSPRIARTSWQRAATLARHFLTRCAAANFSHRFEACLGALEHRFEQTERQIERLG